MSRWVRCSYEKRMGLVGAKVGVLFPKTKYLKENPSARWYSLPFHILKRIDYVYYRRSENGCKYAVEGNIKAEDTLYAWRPLRHLHVSRNENVFLPIFFYHRHQVVEHQASAQ